MFRVRNIELKTKPLGVMGEGKLEILRLYNVYRNGKKSSAMDHRPKLKS